MSHPVRKTALLLCLGACGGAPSASRESLATIPMSSPHDQIDLLFMVDNSPSMTPKQLELQARFPSLLQQMETLASGGQKAHYHIGVVTSDLGSAQSSACPNLGGDGGKLQAIGRAAPASCLAPVGGNYIDYDQLAGVNNLPSGQDLPTTFDCMASVGDTGCGFEHQLESVYRALSQPPPENAGFLRANALLVVVFVTDEDDCSAPPDTKLFDQTMAAQYGVLDSYRCSNYGVVCGNPPQLMPYGDSGGVLTNCRAATAAEGGLLFDVQRYLDFFTTPGGVKTNPGDVLLVSLAAPPAPVQSTLTDVTTGQSCSPIGSLCDVTLAHSCISTDNPQLFGDPAVRLSQVVSAAPNLQSSICDESYASAMDSLGVAMGARMPGGGCLPRAPRDLAQPDCRVQLVEEGQPAQPLANCSAGGGPCWQLVADESCGGKYRLSLGGMPSSAGTVTASCVLAN